MANELLWYRDRAKRWVEALPLGNGYMGALLFGDPERERIALNISTLWSGNGGDKSNPNKDIPWEEIKEHIRLGEYMEAECIIKDKVLGDWTECYLPAGDIFVELDSALVKEDGYRRCLDVSKAIYEEKCEGHYRKEAFADLDSKVVIIKYESEGKLLSGSISMESQLKYSVSVEDNSLYLDGKAPSYAAPVYYNCENPIHYDGLSMAYGIRVVAIGEDAKGKAAELCPDGSRLGFKELKSLTLYIYGDTNFEENEEGGFIAEDKNIKGEIDERIKAILPCDYPEIKAKHIDIYSSYYGRCRLSLGEDNSNDTISRLMDIKDGARDTGLINLIFNYGKYLLISSSAPDGEAANLQGIWNVELRAPWSANYTVNINTEMNYWPAEVLGLSDNHQALFRLIKRLEKRGRKAAKEMYGLPGWVGHHNVDIWAHATPVGYLAEKPDSCTYGMWNMSGAWLCRHLYEHYAYTLDKDFLEETALPLMEGAVSFFLGYLSEEEGYLMTMPSTSPENQFVYDGNKRAATTMGSTMDMAIVRELFNNYIRLCHEIDRTGEIYDRVKETLPGLLDYQIGSEGQLQEWYKDYAETDVNHRHVSHMYGLYPSDTIGESRKDLRKACEVALTRRGDDGTGWCIAWKAALWARLLNGDRALDLLKNQMRFTDVEYTSSKGGGVYTNLFCAHPPFQIDGNFGFAAAVSEMLLQSQEDYTRILPALPGEWESGSIQGIRGRGGYEYFFSWQNGRVDSLQIKAKTHGSLRIIVNNEERVVDFEDSLEKTII